MNSRIAMELPATTSESGFSVDEPVHRTKELFETRGMPGFVELILLVVEERIGMALCQGSTPCWFPPCRGRMVGAFSPAFAM